jgi:hypothetical protein
VAATAATTSGNATGNVTEGVTDRTDTLLSRLKALIQQYYTHIERKDYTVDGAKTQQSND